MVAETQTNIPCGRYFEFGENYYYLTNNMRWTPFKCEYAHIVEFRRCRDYEFAGILKRRCISCMVKSGLIW